MDAITSHKVNMKSERDKHNKLINNSKPKLRINKPPEQSINRISRWISPPNGVHHLFPDQAIQLAY